MRPTNKTILGLVSTLLLGTAVFAAATFALGTFVVGRRSARDAT